MTIEIPAPCHENWEAMTPGENGRHCGTCCKTVVDFTGMTPDAISTYLIQHQAEKICGRLTEKQLAREYDTVIYVAATHIAGSGWPLIKKIAAVFVLLFALSQPGNAQASKKELPAIVVTSSTKQIGRIVPHAVPFTVPAPIPVPIPGPVQCLEGRVGRLVITPQKKPTKRKLKRLQKQRKKQETPTPVTGEVAVTGMVQPD